MKRNALAYLNLITFALSIVSAAHGQTFSVIHEFGDAAGGHPRAGVTLKGGVLYGTTYNGGYGLGTIYQMERQGSTWTASLIYPFESEVGVFPPARVVFGPDGRLYGTAFIGGPSSAGTVFSLLPLLSICKTANCFWKPTVMHAFNGSDGYEVGYGDLVWDQQGNLYGTTTLGGNGYGVVFQLAKSGNTWTETTVHNFSGYPDGEKPYGGLVIDSNGNLFGTTEDGGTQRRGTVFELSYVVGVGWQETILHSFNTLSDGGIPVGGVIFDGAGNLFGTTVYGSSGGGGSVFEMSPSGNGWTFQVIYSFPGSGSCGPQASLSMDAAGNLYGTTLCDGANRQGNVFKLTKSGNGWSYTSLYDFTGGADAGSPYSNVTVDTDGSTLYGTALGGNGSEGVVWMIKQ